MGSLVSAADYQDLHQAYDLLENISLATRLTNTIGVPVEFAFKMLPTSASDFLNQYLPKALSALLDTAIYSLDKEQESDWVHTVTSILLGIGGGLGGLPSAMVELPATTTLLFRQIANIAREQGENIESNETKLQCLQVFSFGSSKTEKDDNFESGYLASRLALAKLVTDASEYLATHAIIEPTAPILVRLIQEISARFGIVVSQKLALQAVPFVGAFIGGTVNGLFMSHFQDVARGHFIYRRLERQYGAEIVRLEYQRIHNDRHLFYLPKP